MKRILKNVLYFLGVLLFNPWIVEHLSTIYAYLLFGAYSRKFGSLGKNCIIRPPFKLTQPENIYIGDNFSAGKDIMLQTWVKPEQPTPLLKIGNNVSLTLYCQISCSNEVIIGDGCLFGNNVFVTDNFHGGSSTLADIKLPPAQRPIISKGSVKIGKNVWLGRNVCVLPGVTIGDNSIIGANAVVTKDVPPNSVAAGVPARVIKSISTGRDDNIKNIL